MTAGDADRFLANPLEVHQALRGLEYPAARDELVRIAERNGGSEAALHALRGLPDRSYASGEEVTEAIGGEVPSSGMQGGAPHAGEPQSDAGRFGSP